MSSYKRLTAPFPGQFSRFLSGFLRHIESRFTSHRTCWRRGRGGSEGGIQERSRKLSKSLTSIAVVLKPERATLFFPFFWTAKICFNDARNSCEPKFGKLRCFHGPRRILGSRFGPQGELAEHHWSTASRDFDKQHLNASQRGTSIH